MTGAGTAPAHDAMCLLYPSNLPTNSMCSCGLIARIRAKIADGVVALHSDYDPSGSGDRWHACQDQREHDLLERCEAIARGES